MGKDIVFLHGGHHGGWCWSRVIEAMAARPGMFGRTLALDAPGAGAKRHRDIAEMTLADTVAELNGDVRAAGFRGAVLVGHSMAGIVVPKMVVADPELYSAVILLAVAAPNRGDSILQMMGNGVVGADPHKIGWPLDPATTPLDTLRRRMFCEDMDEATADWLLGECAKDNWPPKLGDAPIDRDGFIGLRPTTYIITLRDGILPVAWQGRLAERFGPQTGIVTMDTPHEPFITHPELLVDTLADILRA
jgi:pimeloyl-ACP methyl ester carboxylesterase